jgi:hypothetical protein
MKHSPNKIIITWPKPIGIDLKNFASPNWLPDRERMSLYNFYSNIENAIKETRIPYSKETEYRFSYIPDNYIDKDNLYFGYHFSCWPRDVKPQRDNVWIIHTSGLSGYFTIDRGGFGGSVNAAHNKEEYTKSQRINLNDKLINSWIDKFSYDTIHGNKTRIQHQHDDEIKTDNPYILITGQISTDVQLSYKNIDAQSYYNKVSEISKNNGYDVIWKPHPSSKLKNGKGSIDPFIKPKEAIEYNGPLHKIIKNAEAVFTINSGTGIESLLHKGKKVFIAGACDYRWICREFKRLEDLDEIPVLMNNGVDQKSINRYLYHLINNVYVDCYSYDKIKTKVDQVLSEYNRDKSFMRDSYLIKITK